MPRQPLAVQTEKLPALPTQPKFRSGPSAEHCTRLCCRDSAHTACSVLSRTRRASDSVSGRARVELRSMTALANWLLVGVSMRRMTQPTSLLDKHLFPSRRMAGMQHWRGPPGAEAQPCLPH
mmetsp:Transcript_34008/g.112572  ORF Transcript_34008/g.112572 Transcript_34008/m.112572 type:complete len:122 (+) Transcript_34008:1557-1922(+)